MIIHIMKNGDHLNHKEIAFFGFADFIGDSLNSFDMEPVMISIFIQTIVFDPIFGLFKPVMFMCHKEPQKRTRSKVFDLVLEGKDQAD